MSGVSSPKEYTRGFDGAFVWKKQTTTLCRNKQMDYGWVYLPFPLPFTESSRQQENRACVSWKPFAAQHMPRHLCFVQRLIRNGNVVEFFFSQSKTEQGHRWLSQYIKSSYFSPVFLFSSYNYPSCCVLQKWTST